MKKDIKCSYLGTATLVYLPSRYDVNLKFNSFMMDETDNN